MPATLRVDPPQLRAAAAAQAEVGAFVAGMAAGRSMTIAADALSGLVSGAACQCAGIALDGLADTLSGDLSAHSERLRSAAERYQRTDEECARRLKRPAE